MRLIHCILIIVCQAELIYDKGQDVLATLPQVPWTGKPPSVFCKNNLIQGFESALGLDPGWTLELSNVLDLSFVGALASLLGVSLADVNESFDQLGRPTGGRKRRLDEHASSRTNTSVLFQDIEVLTYRKYIERMNAAMDKLDERAQFDPDGPFLPTWNLMQYEYITKMILQELPKHNNVIVSTILKNFGLNYDPEGMGGDLSLNMTLPDLLAGVNDNLTELLSLAREEKMEEERMAAAAAEEEENSATDESCDLMGRAEGEGRTTTTTTPRPSVLGSSNEARWTGFWRSSMVTYLVNRLFGRMVLSLNGLKIYAKMSHAGVALCRACDASYALDGVQSDRWACTIVSIAGWLAGCGRQRPQCDLHRRGQFPVPRSICTKNGPPIDPMDENSVVDLTMTHEPPVGEELINQHDGRVSYWLYRATQWVGGWASKSYLCGFHDERPRQLVPGWDTIAEWQVMEEDADLYVATNQTATPSVIISKKRDSTCDYLITCRGTITDFEWVQDWHSGQVWMPQAEVLVHSGAFGIASAALPFIQHTLEKMQELYCSDRLRVTITGHSLGGANAEQITLMLGTLYGDKLQLELVTFGAVNTLAPDAHSTILTYANVTSWMGQLDAVPGLPCTEVLFGSPRCRSVETYGNWGEGRDMYENHPNLIAIGIEQFEGRRLKQLSSDVWGTLKFDLVKLKLEEVEADIPGPMQIVGWHFCSYACYLSRTFCVEDEAQAWQCDPDICPLI